MTLLMLLASVPLIQNLSVQVSVFIGVVLLLRFTALHWPSLTPGRWLLLLLTLAGGINVYHAYHTFAGQESGTALLATMLALKLLEMPRLRDLKLGTVLFGFLLVTQFLFNQSPWLALYLASLVVANFALMVDLNNREAKLPVVSALKLSLRLTLQAIPLTLVLFALFPRLSAPLWNLGQIEDRGRSGIKDWLEPGSISELVLDGGTAFRARFEGTAPNPDTLYWRGPVMWTTDGRRWRPAENGLLPAEASPLAKAEDRMSYSVLPEPSGQRWLFALDLPVVPPVGAKITGDYQVLTASRIDQVRPYQLVSALKYDTGNLDLQQELTGLQLPDNITPRMLLLVEGWKEEAKAKSDLVRLGLEFFNREPFHYTLLPPKLGENPADAFLFQTRRGFCEHFATSFALLMRIAGIPSRIVLGYLGGEVNPIGGNIIVRQSDAHAWVEVWLKGKGWVRVDPTAAVSSLRIDHSSLRADLASGTPLRFRLEQIGMLVQWVHNLRLLVDAVDAGWRNWVVGLSKERQDWMLEHVGLGYLKEYGLVIAMVVASSVMLAMLFTFLRLSEQRHRDPLERIYTRFCRKLERAGYQRRLNEGPSDFCARVVAERPDLQAPLDAFLGCYIQLRYGPATGDSCRAPQLDRFVSSFHPSRR